MNIDSLFLKMFCSFVREEKLNIEKELTEEDWMRLYQLANLHHINPIILEMAVKMPGFENLPVEFQMSWKREAMMSVIRQTQKTAAFLSLYEEINRQGIYPLVVKGAVCRNMYAQPDFRMSADEDLLVKKEDFKKLDAFLLAHGFRKLDEQDETDLNILHEVGYQNPAKDLYLEIHLTLFPEESGAYGHFNKLFPEPFENAVDIEIDGKTIKTLSYTEHFLYLLCHSAKHFLHSGFGVRQLCDIILFAEKYGSEIDWQKIIEQTKEQHMYTFMIHLFDIGRKELKFNLEQSCYPETLAESLDSKELLDDLLAAGVFGKSSMERVHSANITLAAANQEKKTGGVIASLFPSRSYMEKNYEYVHRHAWLLPIGWIHRILGYLMKEKNVDNKKVLEVGNQRVLMLKKYGMIDE